MVSTPQQRPCPGCGKALPIPPEAWGHKTRCPVCDCKSVVGESLEILEPPKITSRLDPDASTTGAPAVVAATATGSARPARRPLVPVLGLGGAGWFALQRGRLLRMKLAIRAGACPAKVEALLRSNTRALHLAPAEGKPGVPFRVEKEKRGTPVQIEARQRHNPNITL